MVFSGSKLIIKNMFNKQKIFLALFVVVLVGGFGFKVLAISPMVTITEVMANPDGADTNREWIEIYNYGADPVVIIGGQASTSWRFKDSSSHLLNLGTSTVTLMPGGLVILASDRDVFLTEHQNFSAPVIDTTMSLTNAGGQVSISNDNGQSWFEVVNYSTTTEGRSWEKINPTADNQNINWRSSLSSGGSPGQLSPANIDNNQASSTPNQEVEVVASSTPSSTPEVIVEQQASSTAEVEVITQTNDQVEVVTQSNSQDAAQNSPQSMPIKVIINELLPNPIGSDETGEFIELYNPNSLIVNLDGWQLQDQSPMVFTIDEGRVTSTLIFPQSYLTIYRPQSKLVLNNSGSDGARLYNPLGELVDEVNYSEAEEGQSYSLVSGNWLWQSPTPNQNNNLITSQNQVVNSASATIVILDNPGLAGRKIKLAVTIAGQFKPKTFQWDFGDGGIEEENKVTHIYEQAGQYLIKVTITDATNNILAATTNIIIASSSQAIKISSSKLIAETIDREEIVSDFSQLLEVDSKTAIQLSAAVVIPAGITKKDQIWLGEYNDETGEVTTDNLWPLTVSNTKVLAGQVIIVPIKVSQLASGPKLRLAGELKVIDQIAGPSVPEISLVEATEAIKNSLASVSGIIIKVNQKSLVIADEDNELKIILTKSNSDYKVGDQIKTSGLITMSGKTLVLYPNKIEIISKPPTSTVEHLVTTSTTTVPQASNKQPAYIVGGLSVLAGLGWALLKWRSVV